MHPCSCNFSRQYHSFHFTFPNPLIWYSSSSSMELHLLMMFILTMLSSLYASYAAVPSAEIYWKSMLSRTPMPGVLHDLLPSEKKTGAIGVGGRNKKLGSFEDNAMSVDIVIGGLDINVGDDGVSVGLGPGGGSPFSFSYGSSKDQLMNNPNGVLFFLEKDLQPGRKLNILFTKTGAKSKFLPREVAERIPFSTAKFPEILHQFSINPSSSKAAIMKKTVEECEQQAVEGEDKYCATSLEAMVDFSISKLGKNVQVMATEVHGDNKRQHEHYSITKGARMVGDKVVSCHSQRYLYPVFYCHEMHATRAYSVSMVAADRTKANAVAVCHTDTSKWNPNHMAFHVLKVQPGSVPICHFLPEDHILWIAN